MTFDWLHCESYPWKLLYNEQTALDNSENMSCFSETLTYKTKFPFLSIPVWTNQLLFPFVFIGYHGEWNESTMWAGIHISRQHEHDSLTSRSGCSTLPQLWPSSETKGNHLPVKPVSHNAFAVRMWYISFFQHP